MAKVLCIDDDKDILEICEVVLAGQGHKVETAPGGKEGLRKALSFRPDLIVMDVIMDDLTDGFQTAYKLRADKDLRYVPILMLTSINDRFPQKFDGKKDGEYLPVDAFMEKPLKPKEFLSRITTLLALKKEQINVEGKIGS